MPVIQSAVSPASDAFRANSEVMEGLLDELRQIAARTERGGSDDARQRHVERGKLLPRERLSQQRSARTLGGEDREDGSPVIIKTLGVSGMAEWKELELFERGD